MTTKTLILSHPNDGHVQKMMIEFDQLNHPYVLFDPIHLLHSASFSASMDTQMTNMLHLPDGSVLDLAEITSIWYRRPTEITASITQPEIEQTFVERELRAGIWGWLRGLDVCWVNHPDAVRAAAHKPEQLQRALSMGFEIPRTLITNEPEAFLRFYEACHEHVIYKLMGYPWYVNGEQPLSAYTSLISQEMLADAHKIAATLHLFQEYIPKRCDLRVIVMGETLFAVEIHPLSPETQIDFRVNYSELTYVSHLLPEEIQRRLLILTRSYNLLYAAYDLVITPDGRYIYLELNPLGQFGWLETYTGLPLYRTLAQLFKEGRNP